MPVFWATDLNYIWVALFSSLAAVLAPRLMTRKDLYRAMLYVDGLGVSMFAIQAAHKVRIFEFGLPVAPILLGVLTAIGGGLVRDLLAGSPTVFMRRELYAVPITIGCTLYVILLTYLPGSAVSVGTGCAVLILGLRSAAIHWNLSVPKWMLIQSEPS